MPCNDVWGVREVGGGGSTGLAVRYGIPAGDCTRVYQSSSTFIAAKPTSDSTSPSPMQ